MGVDGSEKHNFPSAVSNDSLLCCYISNIDHTSGQFKCKKLRERHKILQISVIAHVLSCCKDHTNEEMKERWNQFVGGQRGTQHILRKPV